MNKTALFLSIAGALLVTGGLYMVFDNKSNRITAHVENLHQSWKIENSKTYSSSSEETYRKQVFAQNYETIVSHNASGASFTMALNKFADITPAEFKAKLLGFNGQEERTRNEVYLQDSTTDSVDWRTKGAVSEVKNQGQCGSCWAFSATGSMEGAHFLKHNVLVSLSEQQLVACSKENHGCFGGLPEYAFKYAEQYGMQSEASYPYKSLFFWGCHYDKTKVVENFKQTSHINVPKNDNDQLKSAVEKTPTSIGISADLLQLYKEGTIDSKNCGTKNDHGVLIVGYGVEQWDDGKKYWLIKNSWGGSWGDHGYFKVLREEGVKEAMCGLAQQANYPVMG